MANNSNKNKNMVPRSQYGTPGSNMVWTNETVAETDFMVFRDQATNKIINVVAPNGLQVGLFDPNFTGNLTATGHITGSGQIYAHHNVTARLGFTGSLQKLYNGSDFLQAGSNVTITNNDDGSISISANSQSTTANALTAGSGLDMGGTFDGSVARTLNVDINSETNVTAATGDFVLIYDVSSGLIRKTTVGSIQGAGASLDIAGLSNTLTDTTLNSADLFAVSDSDDSDEVKKITVEDVGQYLASSTNSGIGESSGKLTIDMNDLTAGVVAVGSDSFSFIDADDNTTKKESIADLVSGVAGTVTDTGLAASSGVLSVDITNQTSVGTLSSSDEVLIYDVDTAALKKATVSDLAIGAAPVGAEYVVLSSDSTLTNESVLTAGDGLDLSGATFSVDLKSSGGLKITSTELAIEPGDFAGTGLEDDGSDNLRISTAAAGTGLSGGGGSALSVDYGSTSGTAVQGNTSFSLSAGYGLSGGISSSALGGGISGNLDVEPEDFAGIGTSVSSNNINTYLSASSNIAITTGSDNQLTIAVNDDLVLSNLIVDDIKANSISGSLTTLRNGDPFLQAGTNITLSTGSDGSITITASGESLGTITEVIAGTGLSGGGSSGDVTLNIDDSVVATLTGSVFSGTVTAPALSGSLTRLSNGDPYLLAGSGISLATGSDGSVTITGNVGDITEVTAGVGLSGGGNTGSVTLDIDDSVVATLTSSVVFSNGISGSLTQLADGTSYIIAGNNITVSSASNGAITISSTNTNTEYTSGNGLILDTTEFSIDDSVVATLTGSVFSGNIVAQSGLSGSLQRLSDGTAYLTGSGGIAIITESNGQITISGENIDFSPASPVNSVQFNNAGIFGGDSDFVYDSSSNVLTLSGTVQQLTASVFSSGYSGSVNLITQTDFDSDITFILPQTVGEKFQFLQTDGTGSLTFDYADRVRIQVRNNSGYDLLAGTPVYVTGYNAGGDRAYIAASSASLDSTMPAAAVLAEDLDNNSNGHAALIGFLEGVDTDLFNVGDTLYVASDGGLTNSKPLAADDLIQNVGFVLKAANNGIMYVTSPGRTNDVPNDLVGRAGLSGSLQMLADGTTRYLVGTGSITVYTASNGQVVVSGSEGNVYTAGTGLDLSSYIFSIDDSVVATLTGSVFSGTVTAPAFSGSLTHLEDGSSYLIAGSNVTITSASNGSITISSTGGGGGSITATSGSTSIASMSTIRFGPGLIMNEDASGIASVTASIGEAEDGVYTDGLFLDFTPNTPIGTAVDRFNEILAALSPSPAPNLDDISETVTNGITAFLSFGSSSDQTSASPAYPSVLDSAGIGDEVDVNESYSSTVSGNDIRLGIYDGTQDIEGILNDDVSSNSQGGGYTNYPANSFGDGDNGVLKMELNGSVIKEIDLTVTTGAGDSGSGSASELNSNGSGFTSLSTATNGTFSNGNSFETFKHRTGEYVVKAADQRNGWNYLRIQHVKSGSTTTTNYVEWVNDDNSDALASAGNSMSFEGSGSIHLSGVEYFQSGSLIYNNRVSNAYRYIYDTNNITFSTSNSATLSSGQSFTFSSQTKPTIDTGAGEDHAKQLHLTSSSDLTASYFINGSVTAGTNVTHPLKPNISNSGQATASQILMYNLSNTSTNLVETFRRENYRIISGSYDTQSEITDISNIWDSETYMTSSNGGHSNGLQFYNQRLLSPINTISSGDFTGFSNGPSENPDYSGVTGTRTFYRWFRNTTGSSQYDFSLNLQGSGTIVSHGTSLSTANLSVLVKLPGKTGWMDVAETFVLDSVEDNDGASAVTTVISKDLTLNATNYINVGNIPIESNEYVLVCIKADESWTGYISNITVVIGAGTGTLSPVPDLDDIDCDQDGTDANLSFGAAKSIASYSNPTAAAGFTAADLNDLYQTAETSNNLRRSIFNGATTLEGDLNEDVGSPGNDYVANAFSDASSGSLKLEVNGSIIHELEITGSSTLVGTGNPGSGTGTSLNSDGSGFISLSNWGPGLFDNGVPRYSETQRTAKYRIVSSSQRDGWNYARVIHSGSWGNRETNYIEWIVDANSEAMSSAGNGLSIFGDNSHSYLSGVKYFNSPSGSILTRISNIYKNVYSDSSSAISFTSLTNATASRLVQSGSGLSSTKTTSSSTDSLQTLSTTADSQNELLHVSGTINFTRSKSLPGTYTTSYSCGGSLVFDHPFKSNLTISAQTTTDMLVWTPSDTSNANTGEYFTGEDYRLVSGSYSVQTDISGGSNDWDSQTSMNDQATYPEHATGLLIYDTYLLAPKDGGSSGDFRNHKESGSIESPSGNVNYSSLTNPTRDYFRSFLNNTTNDRPSVQITLYGDATIVGKTGPNAANLGSNKNVFVEISAPGKTGFLDLGKPSAGSGNYNEGDGCLSGDLDATVDGSGATNTCTFNGVTVDGTVSGAEYLVIRISASENWTGYLSQIGISWS
jgi:hypothetical protein